MKDKIVLQAAAQWETPTYLFDLDAFCERIRRMKALLGEEIKLCYAMKANPFLVSAAASDIDRFEVCSPGEYAICERAGVTGKRIVLSGVNKEKADLIHVMEHQGAGTFTVESLRQLECLEACAAEQSMTVRVILRVTSGNQFGMEADQIRDIVREQSRYPHLSMQGLQMYTGTQKKKFDKIEKEVTGLVHLWQDLRDQYGWEGNELEYGPGFFVPYFEGETETDWEETVRTFAKLLRGQPFSGTWILEMGRFLAAPCGYYLTRIVDQKRNGGQNYAIVDGGIHHLNYYGQTMAMKIPHHRFFPKKDGEEKRWTICGSLCTVGDVLVKNLPLCGADIGDLLVFERVGAYSVTEGIYLFLSRKLPLVLVYSGSEGLRVARGAWGTDELVGCI